MITLNLMQLLHERQLEQQEFAEMSGIPKSSINRMCNNRATTLKLEHITLIMEALELDDFNELFKL